MKKQISKTFQCIAILFAFASCTTLNQNMREPNTKVLLNKSDFELAEQVTAEAKSITFISIDWKRLFLQETGTIDKDGSNQINAASIPVIGNIISDRTANYALYNLMNENPGYDVVFYPQYKTKTIRPILGLGFLLKTTTVETTARLGKLKQ
jgi:hypothetical protein